MTHEGLQHIPSMDLLLHHPRVLPLVGRFSKGEIKMELQGILDEIRRSILSGTLVPEVDLEEMIIESLERKIHVGRSATLRPVINATGIIIHTNLGRALLPESAMEAVRTVSRGYCTLEYDLEKGERGSRHVHCEALIRSLTGAESALVVNNNAAAVTLVLNTLSEGKEAVISRGELVEIGGSFRMPDIMAKSGAWMVEVGTTNKTRIGDYRKAITERTGILVKVHRSNFSMSGFVDEVGLEDLAELSREKSTPLLYDQGSGVLSDLGTFGITGEETAGEVLRKGATLVCFSGDKLLGGPQAGIIIGDRLCLERIRSNPLTRTYRVDKFTLAAMEATLRLHLDPEKAIREVPTLRMLTATCDELRRRGEAIVAALGSVDPSILTLEAVSAEAGGGSLPSTALPSIALCLAPRGERVNLIEKRARAWIPPIIGRIYRDRFYLDLRTVQEGDDGAITDFLREIV